MKRERERERERRARRRARKRKDATPSVVRSGARPLVHSPLSRRAPRELCAPALSPFHIHVSRHPPRRGRPVRGPRQLAVERCVGVCRNRNCADGVLRAPHCRGRRRSVVLLLLPAPGPQLRPGPRRRHRRGLGRGPDHLVRAVRSNDDGRAHRPLPGRCRHARRGPHGRLRPGRARFGEGDAGKEDERGS